MSTPPIKVPTSAPNTSGDPRTTTMHSSNEVPFLCLSARFMLISSFDAWQHVWCLLVHFMLIGDCDCPIYTVKMCGKLKIEFTQNDLLFNSDLCGLSFGSRQNRLVWVQKLLLAASSGYASGDTFLIQFILWKSMTYWIPKLIINFVSLSLAA